MMVLVIGGSGSGKSAYAEELACTLAEREDTAKYYLAAMQVFDQEDERRVARHRALRKGKGFLTIEQPVRIESALDKMETGGRTVLLECISNLTANEMFSGTQTFSNAQTFHETRVRKAEETVELIQQGIAQIRRETTHLIVVSNNVFEDGIVYDPSTMDYLFAMGKINRQLAAWADRVVEVVAGIPVLAACGGTDGNRSALSK